MRLGFMGSLVHQALRSGTTTELLPMQRTRDNAYNASRYDLVTNQVQLVPMLGDCMKIEYQGVRDLATRFISIKHV